MKKTLLALLLLTSCANETTPVVVTTTKHVVIMPNDKLFECPTVKMFPDSKTLTDAQVAKLIVELYKNNQFCKNNIEAVKSFLIKAKETVEKNNE